MLIIVYLVGFWLLIHGFYQLIKYFIVVRDIKQKYSPHPEYPESKKKHKISVFIPVLHEEKILEKFLTDFSLQDYPSDLFEIFVITTQKEYLNESIKPNTIDILRKVIAENRFSNLRIAQIHYPYDSGFKANQLDFAFKQILKEKGKNEIEDTYFLFLDADSEPDPSTIRRFNDSIEDGIEIYQQPLLWFKNIDVIDNPLMRSFAFSQSYFSVSYEIPMYAGRFFPWRLKYLVGNGLFIKGSFLSRIGGFPEIIEDVRIGRLTSFLDTPVKIVPWFGVVETAKNFSIYVKQSSVWFFGCGLFVSDYLKAKILRKNVESKFRDYILLIYGVFKAFRWMNKGLFHLVGLIFSFIYHSILPSVIRFRNVCI